MGTKGLSVLLLVSNVVAVTALGPEVVGLPWLLKLVDFKINALVDTFMRKGL